jgi:two-component system chemotaxis response regulator CheY
MDAGISKILIIDDYELMRAMLRNALSGLGFDQIEEAESAPAAHKLIVQAYEKKNPFDFIFCDWNMPQMSGMQLLKFLRADARFQLLPFVMVTAEAEKEFVIEALKAGATDYMIKPISVAIVRRKIDSIQQRHQKKA